MSKGNGEVQTGWGSRKQLTVHNAASLQKRDGWTEEENNC